MEFYINIVVLFISAQIYDVTSKVTITLNLIQYSDTSGKKCDGGWLNGKIRCDVYMVICPTGLSCIGNKNYRIADTKGFLFADEPLTRPYNPSHWNYNRWEVFDSSIKIMDYDSTSGDDLIGTIGLHYHGPTVKNLIMTKHATPDSRMSLKLSLTVQCDQHFFGDRCDVECISDVHHKCLTNGKLVSNQTTIQTSTTSTTTPTPTPKTREPTTPPTTREPITPPTTREPTTPPTTREPITPPTAKPTTREPTTPPTTREPTTPPTTTQTTRDPTTPPTTREPTTPLTTREPTTPPTTREPITPPTTREPTTPPTTREPITPPTTREPTIPPTTREPITPPTAKPTTREPTTPPTTREPATPPTTREPITPQTTREPTIPPTTREPITPPTAKPTTREPTTPPTTTPTTREQTTPPTTREPITPPTTREPTTTPTTTPTTREPTTPQTTRELNTSPTTREPTTPPTTREPTTTPTTREPTIPPTTREPITPPTAKPTTREPTTPPTTREPTTPPTTRKPNTSPTTREPTTPPTTREPTTTPTTREPTTTSTTTMPTTTPASTTTKIPLTLATYKMSFIGYYNPSGNENVPIASCDTYYSRVLYKQLNALKPILENSCQRNLAINISQPVVLHQSSKNMTISVEVNLKPTNESDISIACNCEGSITYQIQMEVKTAISHQQTPYCPWIHMPTEKHEMQKQGRGRWFCNDGRTLPNYCELGTIPYCNK